MRDSTAGGMTWQEGAGLTIAAAAHVALLVAFTLAPPGKVIQPPPERMEVTFSEDVSDQSTSPDPAAQAAPDVAPELGEPQPEPEPVVEPAPPQPAPPKPQPAPPKPQPAPPKPAPRPVPKPQPAPPRPAPPKPVAKPQPAPARPAPPKPVAKPVTRPAPAKPTAAKPVAKPATKPTGKPAGKPADTSPRRRPDAPSGASRVGSDFLNGIPAASAPGTSRTPPAATIGPEVRSSLASAISRQIKPRWAAPQGVDADKLVTILAWDLDEDGSLIGRPRVVSQQGITPANEAQAKRHAEQAIRAVQLAAPFDLPAMYYSGWKRIAAFRFDRKLSQ